MDDHRPHTILLKLPEIVKERIGQRGQRAAAALHHEHVAIVRATCIQSLALRHECHYPSLFGRPSRHKREGSR
ncbi:hypothetical protein D3C81_494910 [compost metagenome]